ncbi:hypothetical protein HK101_000496, partial [Irineochytrium annulatum]
MGESVYQSLVCFYTIYFAVSEQVFASGRDVDKDHVGVIMAILVAIEANLFVAINMHSWTLLSAFAIGGSIAITFLYTEIYAVFPFGISGVAGDLFGWPVFWLILVIQVCVGHMPRVLAMYARRTMWPSDLQIVQEIQKFRKLAAVSITWAAGTGPGAGAPAEKNGKTAEGVRMSTASRLTVPLNASLGTMQVESVKTLPSESVLVDLPYVDMLPAPEIIEPSAVPDAIIDNPSTAFLTTFPTVPAENIIIEAPSRPPSARPTAPAADPGPPTPGEVALPVPDLDS